MGALKIDCYCNERQMTQIVNIVKKSLYNSDIPGIQDIDEVVDDLRIYIEFDTYMDAVSAKAVELLDKDWDLLYEDTAVLRSRLKNVLKSYNEEHRNSLSQAREIYRDQFLA